jgi:hypothetical protein
MRADYFAAYRNLKLSRDEKGVLVAEFHSNGGAFIMTAQSHTEFVDAFHRIGQDRANSIEEVNLSLIENQRERGLRNGESDRE